MGLNSYTNRYLCKNCHLSHDIESGIDMMPCIKIDESLNFYIFIKVCIEVITSFHIYDKILALSHQIVYVILMLYDK